MASLRTTLHLQQDQDIPEEAFSSNSHYAFVSYSLNTAKRHLSPSSVRDIDKNSILAANSAEGVMVFEDYDTFMKARAPEMRARGLEVDDPADNIKRYDYVKNLIANNGFQIQKDNSALADARKLNPMTDGSIAFHVKAGKRFDHRDTVVSALIDKDFNLLRYVHKDSVLHFTADENLVATMTKAQFDEILPRLDSEYKVPEAIMQKYYGDKDRLFFGVDRMRMSELVTPGLNNQLKCVVNVRTNSIELMQTRYITGHQNAFGETSVKKIAVVADEDGKETHMSFARASILYKRATREQIDKYLDSQKYMQHPLMANVQKASEIIEARRVDTPRQPYVEMSSRSQNQKNSHVLHAPQPR